MNPSTTRAALALLLLRLVHDRAETPPRPAAPPQPAAPAPKAVKVVASENPVTVLTQQIDAGLPAQEAAAGRLARLLLSKSGAQAYVADAVKKDADQVKRLNALPIVWVKKLVAA